MTDNRNTILAVILSGLVLIGWQYFFNLPQMEKQRAAQQAGHGEDGADGHVQDDGDQDRSLFRGLLRGQRGGGRVGHSLRRAITTSIRPSPGKST